MLLCDNVPRKEPRPTVVETLTEDIPQQYPAHLACTAALGVMLHVYRDDTLHLESCTPPIFDPDGSPQCCHTFPSLVRHD